MHVSNNMGVHELAEANDWNEWQETSSSKTVSPTVSIMQSPKDKTILTKQLTKFPILYPEFQRS
jgi:hypothetical protein